MAVNMFDKPVQGKFINTYAKLPFAEIAGMGDQLQKASDKSLDAVDALGEMTYIDTMKADDPAYQEQVKGFNERIDEIQDLHLTDPMRANYLSRQLGREIGKWRNFGEGKHMADNYAAYQANVASIEKSNADRETKDWAKQKALAKFQGTTGQTPGEYNRYESFSPVEIDKTFDVQANSLAEGWAYDEEFKIYDSKDGKWKIDETLKQAKADEIFGSIYNSLKNDPNNVAKAAQDAEIKLGNNQSFVDGQGNVISREQAKQQLMEQSFRTAANHAANKYGFVRSSATMKADQFKLKAYGASLKNKNNIYNLTTLQTGFTRMNSDNIDDYQNKLNDAKTSLRSSKTIIDDHVSSLEKAELASLQTDPNNAGKTKDELLAQAKSNVEVKLKNDQPYQGFLKDYENAQIDIANQEAFLQPIKAKVIKTSPVNFSKLTSKKFMDRMLSTGGALKYASVKGFGTDKLKEVLNDPTGEKLRKSLEKSISNGESFENAMLNLGFHKDLTKEGVDLASIADTDRRNALKETLGQLRSEYFTRGNSFDYNIKKTLENEKDLVRNFNTITGYMQTKDGNRDVRLIKDLEDLFKANLGQGWSTLHSPSGKDGLSVYKDLEENYGIDLGERTMNKTKDRYTTSLHYTDGVGPSGDPIVTLSVRDANGENNISIPITSKNGIWDRYEKVSDALLQQYQPGDAGYEIGTQMHMKKTRLKGRRLGQIVNQANIHSMYTSEGTAKDTRQALIGAKIDGKQVYIRPKKGTIRGKEAFELVTKDSDSKYDIWKTDINGEKDLLKVLYEASQGK